MTGVSFMIVNEQRATSRAMYWELKRRAPPGVPVYQQAPLQNDVWEILDGDKDDFLVYDRCGLLTFHVVLPYSLLSQPYVEAAIRATYFKNICNCTAHANHTTFGSDFTNNGSSQLNQTTTVTIAPTVEDKDSTHHHNNNHHNHHHHHLPQPAADHNQTNPTLSQQKK
ncbi:unnamed protein product [Knipowitschia caucasica]